MATKTGIRLSGRQLATDTIGANNIGPDGVGPSELADGSVTGAKLAVGSVSVASLADEVSSRLIPVAGSDRDYVGAMERATSPGASNPFVTRVEIQTGATRWAEPFDDTSAFRGDAAYVVRVRKSDGVPFMKDGSGDVVAMATDHSLATNLESLESHRHVSAAQLGVVDRLSVMGFDPSDPAFAKAFASVGSPGSRMAFKRFNVTSLSAGAGVVLEHPQFEDRFQQRTIHVYKPTAIAGLASTSLDMGHGFWVSPDRVNEYNFGVEGAGTDPRVEFQDGVLRLTGADGHTVNSGIRGTFLSRKSGSTISEVEKDPDNVTVLRTDSAVSRVPYLLSNLSIGEHSGWVGPKIHPGWKSVASFGSTWGPSTDITLMADGQGGQWVFGLDVDGHLCCNAVVGGRSVSVHIQPYRPLSPWTTAAFDRCTAAIIIHPYNAAIIRRIVVFARTQSGEQYILLSDPLPMTLGNYGRLLADDGSTNLTMDAYQIPSETFWSSHPDFVINKAQIVVPAQGTSNAQAFLLATDGSSLLWVRVPCSESLTLQANTALIASASKGWFGIDEDLGVGGTFKAVAGPATIEAIVRSAEGGGGWRREQMALKADGSGLDTITARTSEFSRFFASEEAEADICCVTRQVSTETRVVVFYGALEHNAGSSRGWFGAQWLSSESDYLSVTGECEFELDLRAGAQMCLRGGTMAEIMVVDAYSAYKTSVWEARFSEVAAAQPFISPPVEIDGTLISFSGSPVRAARRTDGTSDASIHLTRQVDQQVLPNDHDVAMLIETSPTTMELWEKGAPVRMRRKPAAITLGAYATNLDDVESMNVFHDGALSAVEGARMTSVFDPYHLNEWVFVTGGMPEADGTPSAYGGLTAIRKLRSALYADPVIVSGLGSDQIGGHAYHGQYSIYNRVVYGGGLLPANSAVTFLYGGMARGTIDDHIHGGLASGELVRVTLAGLDSTASTLASADLSPSVSKTPLLTSVIPPMIKPEIFQVWTGTEWAMIFVDAPNVYALLESSGKSFFSGTMPDATSAVHLTSTAVGSMSGRAATAFFQLVHSGTADQVCWNPDVQQSLPGKTFVLSFGGESVDTPERSLRVLVVDPANIASGTSAWAMVSVSGGRLPEARQDATLVYSGLKYSSANADPHHLFYLFGGKSGSETMSDLWVLEYWYVTAQNGSLAHYGQWTYLTSSDHMGLVEGVRNAAGCRRPTETTLTGFTAHGLYLYGGKTATGGLTDNLVLHHLPTMMKNAPSINIETVGMDHGGFIVPVAAFVVSEGIDIDAVSRLEAPLTLDIFETDGMKQAGDWFDRNIRVGVAIDNPLRVYSTSYNGSAYSWTTNPVDWDSLGTSLANLRDFKLAIANASVPLVRGNPSWFPAAGSGGKKLFLVFFFDNTEPARVTMLRRMTFSSRLVSGGTPPNNAWELVNDANLKSVLVGPRSIYLYNASQSTMGPFMLEVGVPV